MRSRTLRRGLRNWRLCIALIAVIGAGLAGYRADRENTAVEPSLAFATPVAIKIWHPDGSIQTVTSVLDDEIVAGFVWSDDATHLAWLTITLGSEALTLYDYDLQSGQLSFWSCALCSGIDFLGNSLVASIDPTQNPKESATELLRYVPGALAPIPLTITGLPKSAPDILPNLYMLAGIPDSNSVLMLDAATVSGKPDTGFYRVDELGNAHFLYSLKNASAPQKIAMSPDERWLAYSYMNSSEAFDVDGSGSCNENNDIAIVNLQTGAETDSEPLPINTYYYSNNDIESIWFDASDKPHLTEAEYLRCEYPGTEDPTIYDLHKDGWHATGYMVSGASTIDGWQAELTGSVYQNYDLVPIEFSNSQLFVVRDGVFQPIESGATVFAWSTAS